jgi:hypothetical protein
MEGDGWHARHARSVLTGAAFRQPACFPRKAFQCRSCRTRGAPKAKPPIAPDPKLKKQLAELGFGAADNDASEEPKARAAGKEKRARPTEKASESMQGMETIFSALSSAKKKQKK